MRLPHHASLALLVSLGCSAPEPMDLGTDDELADLYCERVELEHRTISDANESLTATRIRTLNDYAEAALRARQCGIDETLARRDALVEDRPNIADLYSIEVGNEATCFSGGSLWVDFDLVDDDRYLGMKQQVERAIEFIAQFHEDAGGVRTVIFDKIIICPKEAFEEELVLDGPRLYISVPFDLIGYGVTTFDARELREKWSAGDHFNKREMADKLKLIWPLFDPAGTVRFSLRSGLGARALGLASRLVNLEGKVGNTDIGSLKNSLQNILRDETKDPASGDASMAMEEGFAGRLEGANAEELTCFAEAWRQYLAEPTNWTTASEATISSVYKQAAQNSLSVNVEQNGTIVVGNTHFINVNLDAYFSAGYKDLERYIEVVEVQQDITWKQDAFFAIYTVDDINVNVNISYDKLLGTAGAELALTDCGL